MGAVLCLLVLSVVPPSSPRQRAIDLAAPTQPPLSAQGSRRPAPADGIFAGGSLAPPDRATPLADLLSEADRQNPEIQAALHAWHADTESISQASTLPDPHVTVQHMAVGSPVPFSDFATNNFAYLGLGASQSFPWPGTLALRGQAATQASDAARAQVDVVRRRVRADLKATYAQLGAVQETLAILERDGDLLAQMEQIAEARYRVGQGSQQEVLRVQLEQTTLQRDVAVQQQERDSFEARLKRLLGRAQQSPDIVAQPPVKTALPQAQAPLTQEVASHNPALRGQQLSIAEQETRVALARKGFKPDFAAQFMWQHTAARFPDYYMFTFDISVPLYWRQRQVPALAEAADHLSAARTTYAALLESDQAELSDELARARTADHLLTIYQRGLIPQARAAFDAALAAYQSGQLDFESLLGSFRDVLDLDRGYWQVLADHEVAVARIEGVTGVDLP